MVAMVLEYFEIAPSQLMPNSWQLLMVLQVLIEQHDIMFGMLELLHGYFIKEHDREKGRRLNMQLVEGLLVKEHFLKILAISKSQRDCWFLLFSEFLASSSLWAHVSEEPRGILSEFSRHIVPIVMIKRGMEIIGSDLSLCGRLNSTECKVIDQVMLRVIASSLDALERRKEEREEEI
ncbi:Uncharacterized protein Adt_31312 [Abeliophyllum distichum]|uniref:Maturase K n=1 Tax=Abeliophyllum distichum TaxID=126358 RepID=A0ABD1REJ9_9LAMI